MKFKILKGACCGCHKNNLFVMLEYFLLEGLEKDTGGEVRIICRPLGLRRKMVVCLELMLLTVTSSSNSAALYLCLSLCYIQESVLPLATTTGIAKLTSYI
ncbi:hypothetical protein BVRB_2g026420 [Beta vulgaris subsp. vulgaris]|nr:hypothetical protein BVRB_2g026420 [Beta vulgaris subsp. vulgaris]